MTRPKIRRRAASFAVKVLELRAAGRTGDEIASSVKAPRSTVYELLKRFEGLTLDPGVLEAYERNRPAFLSAVELRLLQSLVDEDKIAAASLNNRAYSFTQAFNARRLECGQSTANIALHELVERIERDQARKRRVALVRQPTSLNAAADLADGNEDGNDAAK